MKRKHFLRNSLAGLGAMIGIPVAIRSYSHTDSNLASDCELSPRETAGPFPIKTPTELVRANIISDRKGVALLMNIVVQDANNNCLPMEGVFVDVWHCDSHGYYSEYGDERWQKEDFTQHHFLRGRQTTDQQGLASFISIYPGWYPGRAPHIHVEVLDANEKSLLVTQIAFPDEISEQVYQTANYKGSADTTNLSDGLFANSLKGNMSVVDGNIQEGFTLSHNIVVRG